MLEQIENLVFKLPPALIGVMCIEILFDSFHIWFLKIDISYDSKLCQEYLNLPNKK
jgi:hypothetical protein